MAIEVITFGCRLNTAESEVMRRKAAEAGLSEAVLVNTCAVTGEAVRQAKQAIRRARRANPDADNGWDELINGKIQIVCVSVNSSAAQMKITSIPNPLRTKLEALQ